MTAPKPIEELAATWGAWSRRSTIADAAARAEAQGDQAGAEQLRGILPAGAGVTALDAVSAAHQLTALIASSWAAVIAAAVAEGASWEEIGAATGRSAHRARTEHEKGLTPGQRPRTGGDPGPGDGAWLSTRQVAARTHRHVDTIRRAVGVGDLHGHQGSREGRSLRGAHWVFRPAAVDLWTQGLDEHAQRQACGCPQLAVARERRAR